MTDTTRRNLMLAGAGLAAMPAHRAFAQAGPYPNKTLKIIVGAAPGGLSDAYARLFAEQFTARFNQPAVVENRPGASGIIATDAMVKSPPDGYTLLSTTTGMLWQTRVLYRKLPFDLAKDIAPITVFPSGPLIVAVQEKTGVRNLKELIEYARKNPCTMGSYAVASYPHVFAETLNREHGGKIQAIQYKGEGPMWIEMGTGTINMAVGSFQAFATVRDKGIRPIAVTGQYRSPKLPDVPTLIEQGLKAPIARLEGGLALSAHSAVPVEILELLSKVAVEGNETPRARLLRENFAIPDATKGRAEALRQWREDGPAWIKEVEALGVKLD
ncbi:MAG TPA: tripartite tricarboxylate transporter substrate binding protein [Burkholderiaceae bacterium]|jgi:tripartite-type tricarboxylate transporter receptor subunit TctC|nr:tripartite tricarboxylate transporter substrate binding protein [Burkholderiaceae bacterium]